MTVPPPVNLKAWIDANRARLRPPVGNAQLYPAGDFIIMVVGGPNARNDYHIDPAAELFYQLEGTLTLKTMQKGAPADYRVGPGELFLLPALVPHSPQRPAGSVGLVVERRRLPGELDGFAWYCANCHALLHEQRFVLENIETQFPPILARFDADERLRHCARCGHTLPRAAAPA